ncbi:hypothetical protein OCU04_011433 [Sclerotinia nivalis]|uniref:2EXR domain-containing protein n=1 Tax=Sclerotinia nivalis TaxID=352851 RepID=A0A9X0ABR3_9HELO|nr:hypothetical protein OCU04_011433 [Sclerotinia nivalis]
MPVLTEFTLFPKLCVELRAKIWDFASQEPNRILFDSYRMWRKRKYPRKKANIPISDRDKIFCGRHPDYPNICRLWAVNRVPAILMTCHESRFWAMKHYSLCFEDQLHHKALWFNPKVDTIIFSDMNACFSFVWGGCFSVGHGPIPLIRNSLVMQVVERVVIQESIHTYWYQKAKEMARSFPHLKSLVMRTDNIPFEAESFYGWHSLSGRNELLPSIRVCLQKFWNSDDWKAIKAHDEMPELQIMTPVEMWNIGFAKPLGPSNKFNRRPRISKEKPAQMQPPRRSDRIKAIEAAREAED